MENGTLCFYIYYSLSYLKKHILFHSTLDTSFNWCDRRGHGAPLYRRQTELFYPTMSSLSREPRNEWCYQISVTFLFHPFLLFMKKNIYRCLYFFMFLFFIFYLLCFIFFIFFVLYFLSFVFYIFYLFMFL